MKDFIYQTNDSNCGFTCLKMLLCILHKNPDYLFLPSQLNQRENDLLSLKELAKNEGVILSGYIINNQSDLLNLKTPFILIRNLGDGKKHAVLIKRINKLFLTIYDPAIGKKTILSRKLLSQIYQGVEVLAVESHSYTKYKFVNPPLLAKKDYFKIITLEILAIIAYFFSAYFINNESHFLYPVVLMVLGVVFVIAYKINTYSLMNKFDDEFIRYTFDENKNQRKENYRLMHFTKSGLLTSTSNMILSLSSTLMINLILIIQNLYSVFVILGSALIILIDAVFVSSKIKKRNYDLEILEKRELELDNETFEEYQNHYQEIKDRTYKIAKLMDLKRIVIYFILLIIVVFMSGITENASINFVLFYFAMSMFTYTSLDNVYHMSDTYKDNLINQVKFYDLIHNFNEKNNK